MKTIVQKLAAATLALAMISAPTILSTSALAQSKVTIAVGGGACLCYLPTVLAKQLGEYEKAGLAVELVEAGTLTPDPALTAAVAAEARRNGVIVLTCGTHNNVLRFLPPLTIDEDLLGEALDIIAAAFEVTR